MRSLFGISAGWRRVADVCARLALCAALVWCACGFAPTATLALADEGDGTQSTGTVERLDAEEGAEDASATSTTATTSTAATSSIDTAKVVTIVESAEIAARATLGMSNVTIPVDDPANTIDVGQLADSSFLYDAKIGDLALADSYYNNQTVKIRGEVVGDAIRPFKDGRDACWITLRDFDTGDTISVFVRASDLEKIDTFGAYGRVGTTLEIQGTYHLDCAQHEGDSDIHATVVEWVASGYEVADVFDPKRFAVPVELTIAGLILGGLYWFLREASLMRGTVVKLDRGYPLVRTSDGRELRCEHATALVKSADVRATTGDAVEFELLEGTDRGVIQEVLPRRNAFVRKDPAERTSVQVLAANFDKVLVAEPLVGLNVRRLERELVLAYESGAQVAVLLTKADLAESADDLEQARDLVERVAKGTSVAVISAEDPASVEAVRAMVPAGCVAVLLGKSGVGKSSLVNLLVGEDVQATGAVREHDGKGRHTTVSREMVQLPGGGCVVDMPGVRGLALWDADEGIGAAFADVEELAQQCRFRDCRHQKEPGCAVRAAVKAGELAPERLESYRRLKGETQALRKRDEEAQRIKKRTGHPDAGKDDIM